MALIFFKHRVVYRVVPTQVEFPPHGEVFSTPLCQDPLGALGFVADPEEADGMEHRRTATQWSIPGVFN